ncbi:hypothetical protein J7T55_005266 [Diaporthe amygdali]|uniref:uncharacterized protein n=1 Tax=Phomopsis amygdali TaxID=1214568 RepID=UPI0022FEE466|nr:uncharacterized protein J7T55_005266 [Diaporthe amygdali]KAJ0108289.1 hypothetical protein J7T55_005266 [Diaporthe amygdali]
MGQDDHVPWSYLRLHGQSEVASINDTLISVPEDWSQQSTRMKIQSINGTHYAFSAAPSLHQSQEQTIAYIPAGSLRTTYTGSTTYVTHGNRVLFGTISLDNVLKGLTPIVTVLRVSFIAGSPDSLNSALISASQIIDVTDPKAYTRNLPLISALA